MDTNEIKAALKVYFDACYEGNGDKAREVFHSAAHLYSNRDGALGDIDLDAFVKIMSGSPAPDHPRQEEILSVDFTGENTAVARVKIRVGHTLFTDILSFIRLDGKWSIISKVYSGVPVG